MNYAKKALHGTAYIFVISVLAAFIGYLLRLVLVRGMPQEDYGLFYAVFSLFGLLAIFKELGLNQAVAKFIPELLHKKDYIGVKSTILLSFYMQILFSALIAAVAIIFSRQLATYFFHTSSAVTVIIILAVMFFLMPLENLFRYAFQGFQNMLYFASVELIRMLLILAMSIVMFAMGMKILAPSIAYSAVYVIVPFICLPFFLRLFPQFLKVKAKIDMALVRKLMRFGIPVMIGIFGSIIMLYTDTVVLTYFRGLNDVALYQVASPTSKLLLYLGYAIAAVFLPLSAELWVKGEKDKLRNGIELVYKYSFIVLIPMVMLMLTFPELILKIFFGKGYIAAAPALEILAVGSIFYTIGLINGNLLSGIGRPKENMKIVLYAALFNLAANIIFIPYYGIVGAASTTFVSYLIILIFTSYKVKKIISVSAPWLGWLKILLAGGVFVAVISLLKSTLEMNVWLEIIISVGVASLVYVLLLFLLKAITKEDIGFIRYATGLKNVFGFLAD